MPEVTPEYIRGLLEGTEPIELTACATDDLSLFVTKGGPDGEIFAAIQSGNPNDAKLVAAHNELARKYLTACDLLWDCAYELSRPGSRPPHRKRLAGRLQHFLGKGRKNA